MIATLESIAGNFREAIVTDLQRLKLSGLLSLVKQNEFIRIPNSNDYVYLHTEYMQVSDVKFSNISRA